MGWVSGIATYVMIWWVVIFAVLPWGVERDEGTGQVGAPKKAHIKRKLVVTTVISTVIWCGVYALVQSPYLSFREIAKEMPLQ